jgi:hypothetical protein
MTQETFEAPYEGRMQTLFEQAGIPWGMLTPEQEFGAFASRQFRPGPSRLRSALYDVQQPLFQQYYLQQPMMPEYGGFGAFMGGGDPGASVYGGFAGRGQQNIRALAEQAALIGRMPGAQFFEYMDPAAEWLPEMERYYQAEDEYEGPAITEEMATFNPLTGQYEGGTLGGMTRAQQLMYRQAYGTGEQAAANQAQLANLLALQRTGGGMYGGAMGGAITSALGELRGQLLARDPGANFLDWYLGRTAGAQGVPGGFLPART